MRLAPLAEPSGRAALPFRPTLERTRWLLKQALRHQLRVMLHALSSTTKHAGGVAIAAHLAPLLPQDGVVAIFASTADELDTRPLDALLVSRSIGRAAPRIEGGELVFHVVDGALHDLPIDAFGIPTPASTSPRIALSECALVCVPGLGFDDDGGRIGYGRGYYDRALRGVARERIVGLFLDEQRVERVPMFPGDVRLPRLCTPQRGVVVVDK